MLHITSIDVVDIVKINNVGLICVVASGADSGVSRSDSNVLGHDEAGGNQGSFSELNTEEQFRSAFEIADTNGDGVLSFAEALEVCLQFIHTFAMLNR